MLTWCFHSWQIEITRLFRILVNFPWARYINSHSIDGFALCFFLTFCQSTSMSSLFHHTINEHGLFMISLGPMKT
jgi:hypothetical protein